MKPPFIETLRDPHELQKLGVVNSAKDELFLLFSRANSFRRQEQSGFIRLLTDVASQKDIKIRILTHMDNETRLNFWLSKCRLLILLLLPLGKRQHENKGQTVSAGNLDRYVL
jgi:hypothetical protein